MKIYKLLSVLFLLIVVKANSQFNQVYTNNGTYDLIESLCATTDGGVIAIRRADFLKSVDGGGTWSVNSTSVSGCGSAWQLRSLAMSNKDTYSISGINSTSNYFGTFATVNGGANYSCYINTSATNNYARNNSYFKNGKIYTVTSEGNLFYSANSGSSYSLIRDTTDLVMSNFINDSIGILANYSDLFLINTSNGNLSIINTPFSESLEYVQFVDDSTIYVVTGSTNGMGLRKTNNLGQSWQKIFLGPLNGNNTILKTHFLNKDTGFVYGDKIILRTLDGGNSWQVKRFNSLLLNKLFFVDVNMGYIAGIISSSSYIYKTTNGGGVWADFNYFYSDNAACCQNIPCNFYNSAYTAASYTWVLDGNIVSTNTSPGTLTMSGGNHNLILITNNGSEIDSFSQTIYSAPPLPIGTSINGNPDTTICFGTEFIFGATGTNSSYFYSMWEGGNMVDGPLNGSSSTRYFYSNPLYDTTVITMQLESQYPYCPGNSVERDINVIVYPNTAEDDPYFIEDSVCLGSTAQFVIPNSNASYTYQVKSDGCVNYSQNAVSNSPSITHNIDINLLYGCTDFYYYKVTDGYGCTYNSNRTKLFVDTLHARLYSLKSFGFVGDTVTFNGNSEADSMFWDYDPTFVELISTSWAENKFKILSNGKKKIQLSVNNTSGCVDTTYQYVSGFDSLSNIPTNFCDSMVTNDLPGTVFGELGCVGFQTYSKTLHVDRNGNSYLAGLSTVNINQNSFGSSTLTKMDSLGNVAWKKEVALSSYYLDIHTCFINSVATDSYGNVYVSGRFNERSFTLDAFTSPNASLNNPGAGYIVKLNSQGNVQWMDFINVGCINNYSSIVYNLKVMNDSTIYIAGRDFKCVFREPMYQSIYNNASVNNDGFLVLNEDGMVKKFIFCNGLFEDIETYIEGCGPNSAEVIPSGIDYEIFDDKIYMFYLRRLVNPISINGTWYYHSSFSTNSNVEGLAMISIYDTTGAHIQDIEAFRFVKNSNISLGNAETSYFNNDNDWSYYGIGMTEPHLVVDSKKNIYITHSPYAKRNYVAGTDSLYRSKIGFIFPGQGFIEGSFNSSLVAKYDETGNLVYRNLNDGIILKDFCLSKERELNCIADYAGFFSLQSSNGNYLGGLSPPGTINGLFFTYNENGIIQSYHPIRTEGYQITGGIASPDSCNSNIYFAFASNTPATYDGLTFSNPTNFYMMKVNNSGDCNDLSFCEPQITLGENDIEINKSNWNLYPNPTNGQIQLLYSNAEENINSSLVIYSSIGQKVSEINNFNSSSLTIDVSKFENGLYHLFLFDKDGNKIEQLSFVKQ